MKGIVWFVIIPIVMAIVIPLALVLPLFLLRVHLIANIEFESKIDSGQLILLSLLSSTTDGKPTSQIIAEHVVFGTYKNIDQILSDKLNKYSNCYVLYADNQLLVQTSGCNNPSYIYNTIIPIPYNHGKTFSNITLVVQ